MYKEVGLLSLLILLELSGQVCGECRMNNEYIQHSLGTFTKHEHGKLLPQRFNAIADGTDLELYCQQDAGKIVIHKIKCVGGVLNPKDPVPCKQPIGAKVLETNLDVFCPAKMYRIGIQIQNEFFELYRACYDKQNVRSYFSDALIYWKPIHPKSPRPFFTSDGLITPKQASSFQSKNIFDAFVKIYGSKQSYAKKDSTGKAELLINRGHLTAAGDMLFYDQMTSTFKYVNVVPQFESINSGNWLQIEHWVGNNVPRNGALHVRTGALGVLSLPDFKATRTLQPAYLIPDRKQNPVPEWMYKIVRTANDQLLHVFLTYNNVFNPRKPAAHSCCKTVACPLNLPDSAKLGFSYCCNPAEFVNCLPKNKNTRSPRT